MSVVESLTCDLAALRKRAPDLADSALAASALVLAAALDDSGNSLTSKAMANRELRETVAMLYELAPPVKQEADDVDDLASRREQRRASIGGAGT